MRSALSRLQRFALFALVASAAGCATIPPDSGSDPRDPLETYNRHMSEFNDRVDRAILKPVAQGYVAILPEGVRNCVGNIFGNLGEIPVAVNNLLQGKPAEAVSDICRFAINSTVGLAGCFDIATKMGLEKHNEDFGQTLGRWGAGPGPYFVLPLLGPSTIRDTAGRVVDMGVGDPLSYVESDPARYSLWGTRTVDQRASLLDAEKLVDQAALDRYQFIRNAYLQRRNNLVHDGNPPRVQDPDDVDDEDGEESKPASGDQPATEPKR
jgi:phospholipid-binding lipoprotein MlaA